MNRRGFIGSILAACAAPAIVRADSLMRVFAPHESGLLVVTRVAGNQLTAYDIITREALLILDNQLSFVREVNQDFGQSFVPAIGDFVQIRKPNRYRISS